MNSTNIKLIRESYAGAGAAMASANLPLTFAFYMRLFSKAPQLRGVFPTDIVAQAEKLERTLDLAIGSLTRFDLLIEPLRDLGARHAEYGASVAHFPLITDVLLATLAEACGPIWTDAHEAAWRELFDVVNQTMIEGMIKAQPAA